MARQPPEDEAPHAPKPPPRVAKKSPSPPKKKDIPPPPAPNKEQPQSAGHTLPFIPVAQMPTTPEAVINNLIARELTHPSAPEEPDSDNVGLLRSLISGMADGDVSAIKERLNKKAANQVEKAGIIETIVNDDNFERTALWLYVRHMTEKVIKRAVARGDLTSGEAMVLWDKAQSTLKDCLVRMDKIKQVDSVTMVEKIDIRTREVEHSVQERWKGTSPQGREIIRKKLHQLKKALGQIKTAPLPPAATEK